MLIPFLYKLGCFTIQSVPPMVTISYIHITIKLVCDFFLIHSNNPRLDYYTSLSLCKVIFLNQNVIRMLAYVENNLTCRWLLRVGQFIRLVLLVGTSTFWIIDYTYLNCRSVRGMMMSVFFSLRIFFIIMRIYLYMDLILQYPSILSIVVLCH